MLQTGATLPTVTLADDSGTELSTGDLLGKHLVLYFYPKDDTPGCTNEATQFADLRPRINGSKRNSAFRSGCWPMSIRRCAMRSASSSKRTRTVRKAWAFNVPRFCSIPLES